ncbi:unnamed protein product [Brachionus calyciflorus]|uniref:SRA1/Sec31 domain-containing protein n=1 Tax=Brachionus calyciflorus TaxID=104777 RepID=A0A813Y6D0_9BILA|nr:unnamed protein product [Brachionus calyciflorus]
MHEPRVKSILTWEMSNQFRPGNRERGWNDPPEFLHSENTTTQKRTILNQRVAHSLTGINANDSTKDEKLTEPPKFTSPPTSQVPLIKPISEQDAKTESDNSSLNENSIEELEKALVTNVQKLKDNGIVVRTCDDIMKRVKIFVTNWPKLNDNVKQKMFNLIKALENSELKTANDIHVRLMLDFPSEVSQWMVGIKKLIHELIELSNKSVKTNQSKEQENSTNQ